MTRYLIPLILAAAAVTISWCLGQPPALTAGAALAALLASWGAVSWCWPRKRPQAAETITWRRDGHTCGLSDGERDAWLRLVMSGWSEAELEALEQQAQQGRKP